jgi:hypothetical protein
MKSRDRRRARRVLAALLAAGVASITLSAPGAVAAGASSHAKRTPNVGLLPFAGDVYQSSSNGTLIGVDPSSTPAATPLYNLAGNALNVTWGQFSSASATSLAKTITRDGVEYTDLRITLSGLIPNGVYSLFYDTFGPDSSNPLCPSDRLVALNARRPQRRQPDADSSIADSSGAARFHARVAGDLLAAQSFSIAVIYHFDANTYGPVPTGGEANNHCQPSFGNDAMRQLLIVQQ